MKIEKVGVETDQDTFQPMLVVKCWIPLEPFVDAQHIGTVEEQYAKVGKEFIESLKGMK